jgi:hypothetical protein
MEIDLNEHNKHAAKQIPWDDKPSDEPEPLISLAKQPPSPKNPEEQSLPPLRSRL